MADREDTEAARSIGHFSIDVAEPPPLPVAREADPAEIERALGDFRILRLLGVGAMGTVYLAEHREIGSRIAVKVLKPKLASRPELVQQFYDEARAVNRVGHPGIVRIFDMKLAPPASYLLVMEFLEGRPLSTVAQRPVSPPTAASIVAQVCEALHAAHAVGVVHRDIKPDNVFLVRRGRREMVKLLDFGAAKLQPALDSEVPPTPNGPVLGTPAYMPPEQWRGDAVDGRTDVYAAGVLAFRLLGRTLPLDVRGKKPAEMYRTHCETPVPDLRTLNPAVTDALAEVVHRALAKRRDDRFRTAAEMASALRRAVARPRRRKTDSAREQAGAAGPTLVATWDSDMLARAAIAPEESSASLDGTASAVLDGGFWRTTYQACASTSASSVDVGAAPADGQPPIRFVSSK